MTPLLVNDFANFFGAVHGCEPFPWQLRLAHRICRAEVGQPNWPEYLGLPTASGKTACIDIAVFALALQATLPPASRTAVRRIFFVVDRRVVVHQAYRHALDLAQKLANPKSEIVGRVAIALQRIGADPARPLDVYELHGGIYRETVWVRNPLQPTVITSTVDQYGSRLLFRGYGVSPRTQPIHAALTGNDALVLLDEAHTAAPFAQTIRLVGHYRQSMAAVSTRFPALWFSQLTATPPASAGDKYEQLQPNDLDHPVLGPRLARPKPVRLLEIAKSARMPGELAWHAKLFIEAGSASIAVMVNRVATAREVYCLLQGELGDSCQIALMTGRMRPLDREIAISKVEPLQVNHETETPRPIVVVATQCLEVGADLDFASLITECASLDALRQRFGRLNRAARRPTGNGVILAAADALKAPDPIYGDALAATWRWLQSQATPASDGPAIDFSAVSMDRRWRATQEQERDALLPPSAWSATLLPAHLDLLSQTHPAPGLDPDPEPFLHAPARGNPEVQVVFRADLGSDSNLWADIVALCPPSAAECLPVTLKAARDWLAGITAIDDSGDLENDPSIDDENDTPSRDKLSLLRWRGIGNKATGLVRASELRPGDVLVAPTSAPAAALLGDFPDATPDDQAEIAFQRSRDRAIARLTPGTISITDEDLDQTVNIALDALLATLPSGSSRAKALTDIKRPRRREIKPHPVSGVVVIGRHRLGQFANLGASDPIENWETGADADYPLVQHCNDVATEAVKTACAVGLDHFSGVFASAGKAHDAGKADPRFQAWLRGGSNTRAGLAEPVAKATVAMPGSAREAARLRAGYPKGCRHELYSTRMAEQSGLSDDLLLHLIASHHGYCRPLAPLAEAGQASAFGLENLKFVPQPGSASGHALEHLAGGVTERFWRLTRHHGWWGLAYLETILRLADWACPEPPGVKGK